MSSSIAIHERLAGAVWGHLVGDAVGVPYEFGPAQPADSIEFGAKGTHRQPPGTWSDDGALMLAMLDSLLAKGFDTTDQAQRALAWHRGKAYTPDGDGAFDIGSTTRTAIEAFGSGTPAEEAGPTHDRANGNGSLMRILPLGLVFHSRRDGELATLSRRASATTHGTARAHVACALYTLIVRDLINAQSAPSDALHHSLQSLRGAYEGMGSRQHLDALDHLEAYPERGGRGRVWDSFWSAWDAFAGANDYRETIQRAVAYGNDTDTTAAIAGGLAGIRWGIGGIPWEWLRGMRGRAVVEPLVDRLTKGENPIRVDWIDNRAVPGLKESKGRVGLTFLPGKQDTGGAGTHRRNLVDDVRWMRQAYAVDAFLLLVQDRELHLLGVPRIAEVMAAHGIELIRHPIADADIPSDVNEFRQTLDGLRQRIEQGQNVVVACRGGLGRTGTVAACLLRDAGLGTDEAIALTRATRRNTIETTGQEEFVAKFTSTRGPVDELAGDDGKP